MTRLTVIGGGGENTPPPPACGICGTGHSACGICGAGHHRGRGCPVLRRHLDWRQLKGHTPATIYGTERGIIRLAAWLADPRSYDAVGVTGDPVSVVAATEASLAAWQASFSDLTPGVRASYVSRAKAFYDWCAYEGLRDDNPAARLPMPRVGRRLPRPIGERDLMRALDAAARRIRPWLVLAAWCGLRAREIAFLRREAILETREPPVLLVDMEAAKGGRRERVVPLSSFVVAELAAAGLPSEGYAFRRLDHKPGPCAPWLISHQCNDFLHGLGIAATLHSLRHRMLSQMYEHGRDIRAVQEVAGHASITTTTGYVAWSSKSASAAVEAIPAPGRLHVVREERPS